MAGCTGKLQSSRNRQERQVDSGEKWAVFCQTLSFFGDLGVLGGFKTTLRISWVGCTRKIRELFSA